MRGAPGRSGRAFALSQRSGGFRVGLGSRYSPRARWRHARASAIGRIPASGSRLPLYGDDDCALAPDRGPARGANLQEPPESEPSFAAVRVRLRPLGDVGEVRSRGQTPRLARAGRWPPNSGLLGNDTNGSALLVEPQSEDDQAADHYGLHRQNNWDHEHGR